MQISFERSGGFAGVILRADVDVDALSAADAKRVTQMIQDANFFDLPKRLTVPSPQPDRFQYKITITDKGKQKTVTTDDQTAPESLKPLIRYLNQQSHA
jgi:hypothetical protein